ncbi:MAG: alpha/beta fold hydrolase [Rhodospirillales bacterium]
MKTHLLLLPGLLCDDALWFEQVQALSGHCDCTIADLTKDDSVASMATRAIAGMPDRFAVAGLSMGGYVAMEIMRQVPTRVERLALLDTAPGADTAERMDSRRELIKRVEQGEFAAVIEGHFLKFVHPDRLEDEVLMAKIRTSANHVGPEAYIRQQTAIINRPDSTSTLGKVSCPTLVLCGADDALTPPLLHEQMAAAIPGAELVKIKDSGHLPTLEKPEAVNAALGHWLGLS